MNIKVKTISSRVTNVSLDGEILDPAEFAGIEKEFDKIGVALRENAYDMRDFEDIIDDLAAKWNDLSEVEKNSIALEAAGEIINSLYTVMCIEKLS